MRLYTLGHSAHRLEKIRHRKHLIAADLRQHHPEIEILHIRGNGTLTSPVSVLR
jgi:hypothetical protein